MHPRRSYYALIRNDRLSQETFSVCGPAAYVDGYILEDDDVIRLEEV